jgi:hypothetical protein
MTAKTLSPLALELAEARTNAKFWKERAAFLVAQVKQEKLDAKLTKAEARRNRESLAALKRENAIAKAQVRLQRLLDKQTGLVGVKASKANRKPSKAVTIGAEDNAIAAALVAKRAQAEMF